MKVTTDTHTFKTGSNHRRGLMQTTARWLKGLLLITVGAMAPFGAAHAYVGPGLGLGTLIVILGVIGSALLAIFGIVWYPIKRIFKKRRANRQANEQRNDEDPIDDGDREPVEP